MINLAVEESITNTVSCGLRGVVQPRFEIAVQVKSTVLVLTTFDNGQSFDPTQAASPDVTLPLDERQVGGLGTYLVKGFADRMNCEFADSENRLTLEHDLTPAST